ncbi:glutaredoxin family protein [Gynuella sp.]|uniref:glutaredoxin family protein n=1 Tax=Gynuella sp. TaxID=2969146 RepID=UPI003D12A12D
MNTLFLYTTEGCHLCEEAEKILQPLALEFHFKIEKVEIADDGYLVDIYGTRIPVIKMGTEKDDLGWPFDHHDVIEYLTE